MLIYAAISFSASYASRYEVPQQRVIQGRFPSQKTISSGEEESSHSDGTYAVLNVPEGHHIYGPEKVQEPVYNVLQDPEIMFQNYSPGIDQPMYYALEDLSVKESVESVDNGPANPEPVHNVLDDPEVMFQNYGPGIDQPVYYALEDLSVKDSVESVNNSPTDREPVHIASEDPEFQTYGPGIDQPMYYALEDLSVEDSVESVNNGPTDPEPVHIASEDPEFQTYGPGIDQPMYYALEDLSVKDTVESVDNGHNEPEPVYNVLAEPYAEGAEEPGRHGNVTVEGPVHNTVELPYHYAGYPCKNESFYKVPEGPGVSGAKSTDDYYRASFQESESG